MDFKMPYEPMKRPEGRIDFNHMGRMISGSKRGPEGHVCVFNANVVTGKREKIWFGDLNLTLEAEDLQWYANHLKQDLYVMREMDARFLREDEKIDLSRAVASFSAVR